MWSEFTDEKKDNILQLGRSISTKGDIETVNTFNMNLLPVRI